MADPQKTDPDESQNQELDNSSDTETNQSQEAAGESQETSEAPAGDSGEELELRDDVKQRTAEQFEKLKEQLRQTRDELFQVKNKVEKPSEDKPLYDKTTGLVDIDALEELRRDAREAKKTVESLKKERSENEVLDLYSAYPELKNPKTPEAKELFDEAERYWLHSMSNPDKYNGKPLTQREAADLAKKRMTKTQPKEESESKIEASATASGKPSQGVARTTSQEDLERLRLGTRMGDKDSMIARLRAMRESKAQ